MEIIDPLPVSVKWVNLTKNIPDILQSSRREQTSSCLQLSAVLPECTYQLSDNLLSFFYFLYLQSIWRLLLTPSRLMLKYQWQEVSLEVQFHRGHHVHLCTTGSQCAGPQISERFRKNPSQCDTKLRNRTFSHPLLKPHSSR